MSRKPIKHQTFTVDNSNCDTSSRLPYTREVSEKWLTDSKRLNVVIL